MASTLSAAAERELTRRVKHKLAVLRDVEEVSGSVSATCRYYGISRQSYFDWLKRYEEEGAGPSKPLQRPGLLAESYAGGGERRRSCSCGSGTTSGRRRSPCI